MKISSTVKYALGVTAAAAMLAGCSSGASSLAPTTPTMGAQAAHGVSDTFTGRVGLKAIAGSNGKSWWSPDAKKKAGQLLYVSDDGTNEVETFAWPKPKSPVGSLSGFSEPQGGCADSKGDIYMTNTGDENTLEYNGSKEVGSGLADTGQFPVGCAVDSKGDVAVTNIVSTSDGPGSITYYAGGKGTGKNMPISGLERVFFAAYDKAGNLWIDGENSSSQFAMAELTKKGKVVNGTPSGGVLDFPGGVQYDGKDIVINDQEAATAYQFKKFKIVGSVPLTGASDIDADWLDVPTSLLIGPDAGNAVVEIYNYPKGGAAEQTISGFSEPIGAVVSAKAGK